MFCFPEVPPGLSLCESGAAGSASHHLVGLLAAAWPAPLHNPPPHWVRQPLPCCESSPPWLPVSASPTSLDECFFFISLVIGLPYSSIFCQFSFFVFILLLSFCLWEEAVCLPTPPSWPEAQVLFNAMFLSRLQVLLLKNKPHSPHFPLSFEHSIVVTEIQDLKGITRKHSYILTSS